MLWPQIFSSSVWSLVEGWPWSSSLDFQTLYLVTGNSKYLLRASYLLSEKIFIKHLIYIYRERDRDRDRQKETERERERDRESIIIIHNMMFCKVSIRTESVNMKPLLLGEIQGLVSASFRSQYSPQPINTQLCFICVSVWSLLI